MGLYTKDDEFDITICQKCGADRWPGTMTCPVCGEKYADKPANRNYGSQNGINAGSNQQILQSGSAQYHKEKDANNFSTSGTMYQSPYERGVYDKKPEAPKQKYGLGIPVGLIVKIVLVIALAVSVIVIVSRITSNYIDEQQKKDLENQKVYEDLSDELKKMIKQSEDNTTSYDGY